MMISVTDITKFLILHILKNRPNGEQGGGHDEGQPTPLRNAKIPVKPKQCLNINLKFYGSIPDESLGQFLRPLIKMVSSYAPFVVWVGMGVASYWKGCSFHT